MAGRGRGATLPSWMTNGSLALTQTLDQSNNDATFNTISQNNNIEITQKSDFGRDENILRYDRNRNETSSKERVNKKRSTSRSRDRSYKRRSKSRSRDRDRERSKRSARSRSPESKGSWKPKRNLKVSNFDVRPVDGIEPVGVGLATAGSGTAQGVVMKFPDQQVSYVLERYTGLVNAPQSSGSSSGSNNVNLLGTQNARRLYVGGITTDTTDIELNAFFRDIVKNAVQNASPQDVNDPVIQVYMNREKCFAFVELRSVELTTACCGLDGVKFTNRSGITVTLRIRRPNDFKPELVHGLSLNPIPRLDLHKLGLVSSLVSAESAERIFVGGLPYHLTDENVKELLSVFGPLKSFHLVRDAGSITSKGYGFCEYYDNATAQAAIDGLNGMAIGEKNLTVKFASPPGTIPPKPTQVLPQYNNPIVASMIQPQSFFNQVPQGPQPLSVHTLQYTPPTRVLLLSNMVTSAEIADDQEFFDILEDVKAECEAFGQVSSVIAPRRKDGYQCEGNIYVEFALPSQSKVAAQSLIGRRFAERTVAVSYYDESLFSRRQFI